MTKTQKFPFKDWKVKSRKITGLPVHVSMDGNTETVTVKPIRPAPMTKIHDNETLNALHTLVALHNREKAGDETITMKEWNSAIKTANTIIETELNF